LRAEERAVMCWVISLTASAIYSGSSDILTSPHRLAHRRENA
jgi:hypothetical protein